MTQIVDLRDGSNTKTDILIIVDRSGSMSSNREAHERGLDEFIQSQAGAEGEARLTLIQFDSQETEIVHDRIVVSQDAPPVQIRPRGGTPLLDAMGFALTHMETELAKLDGTDDKPGNVLAIVVTDGEENNSSEWTADGLKAAVKLREGAGWNFTYLGANVDAFGEAGGMGISNANAANYVNNPIGTQAAYGALASNTSQARSLSAQGASQAVRAQALAYTDEQRAAMTEDSAADSSTSAD